MKKYATLFIDTSALPRGLNKLTPELEMLIELAQVGLISVHISTVSIEEWKSQIIQDYMKAVEVLTKSVDSLLRHSLSAQLTRFQHLSTLSSDRDLLHEEAAEAAAKRVDEVFKNLKVVVENIAPSDGNEVMRRYFAGKAPYSRPKHRDDIPDAFIYCALKRVAKSESRGVHFVCKDGGLRSASTNLGNILAYKDLESVLKDDALVNASEELPIARHWSPKAREQLLRRLAADTHYHDRVLDWANTELHRWVIEDDTIPNHDHRAFITDLQEVEDIEIEWDAARSLGPGWLAVPFRLRCQMEIAFYVKREDGFHIDEWVYVDYEDAMDGVYFGEASGERLASVTGDMLLQFNIQQLETQVDESPYPGFDDIEIRILDRDP